MFARAECRAKNAAHLGNHAAEPTKQSVSVTGPFMLILSRSPELKKAHGHDPCYTGGLLIFIL
ncbi:UNVERIFIED_ORG: hypothetical protein C0V67_00790 [Anaplasma ovis]